MVKRLVLILSAVILGLIAVSFGGFLFLQLGTEVNEQTAGISVDYINFRRLQDGVYVGEFRLESVYAETAVYLQDGALIDIELLQHEHDRGEAGEAMLIRIIHQQDLLVDTVSGATVSSVVILKAVEDALQQAL